MFYKWFQPYHAISKQWKRIIKTTNDLCTNIVYLCHHLVKKNNRINALEKIHSKALFPHLNFDWKLIYLLSRILIRILL